MNRFQVKQAFIYNPLTGDFLWRDSGSAKMKPGMPAGRTAGGGYRRVKWNGGDYTCASLIFVYMTGVMPGAVTYLDQNKENLIFKNLIPINDLKEYTRRRMSHINGREGWKKEGKNL